MKRLFRHSLLPTAFAALIILPATQAETTDPVGAISQVIPAHDGGPATLALVNIAFLKSEETAGVLSSVSGFTVTDSNANWTADQFASFDPDGAALFYLELTSGSYEGLLISIISNTTSSVTLNEDISFLDPEVSLPLTYKIRKFHTLADIFSSDNSLYPLRSSGIPAESDVIYLLSQAGEFERYYYRTAPAFLGGSGWRKAGDNSTDYSSKGIVSNTMLIARNGPVVGETFDLITYGSVKLGTQRVPVYDGFNLVGYSFPLDTTLGESGINPADLTSGGTANESDVFFLLNKFTGALDRYYYRTAPAFLGGSGWRRAGDNSTDQSGRIVEAGDGMLVLRRGTTGFDWIDSQPFNDQL